MNNSMKKRLEEYIGAETAVNIYTDPEDCDRFTIGYILGIDDDFILMNEIDAGGLNDGFSLISLNDIFRFETDKLYYQRLMKLYHYKGQKKSKIEIAESMYDTIIKYAAENHKLIEINLDRNCRGFVVEYNCELVVIDLIDFWGDHIGRTAVDAENISIIICDNDALKNQEILCGK